MAFEGLTEKLSAAFRRLRSKGRLTESDVKEAMREIRLALLEADVSYKVVKDFIRTVSERCVGSDVLEGLNPAQMVVKVVNEELTRLMGSENQKITMASNGPTIVMLVGLQGAGKTTNGAKLAGWFKKAQGKRPLLVACDVYRPAAIKQLEVVGGQLDIPVFQMGQEDPVKIAKSAMRYAEQHGHDMVFIDTAGRLHVDEKLMTELQSIKAEVKPSEILLVVDAMTGQDAVNAAQSFNEWLDIDGVMLTKLDGDARGGAALSVKAVTGKPIKFIGVGEKLDQIEPFHPSRMAGRILGMGDVLSLIEKAEQAIDQKKAAELESRLRQNKFTLNDFYDQLTQIRKMGNLQDLLGMVPGMGQLKDIQVDEKAMNRVEAIIQSMTPYERENPNVLGSSRKRRISAGSGTKVEDVNRLLKQFDSMQKMIKQFTGPGASKKMKKLQRRGGFPGIPGL
ncbi:MAG: signal recognition particle protein [Oscillospiraceae bacterium]|nr:signal recognition particle protein [Oscillospiraceae bacterium]